MLRIYGTEEKEYIKVFNKVFESALAVMEQAEDVDVELSVVEEEEIREVNRESRGIDSVTDVLSFPTLDAGKKAVTAKSFPFDVDPESGRILLGEIMICLKRAFEQSVEYGHSRERELGFLLAHGLMHLFGYDHIEEEDEKEMREMQAEVLARIGLER